jgi:hypothetical protein
VPAFSHGALKFSENLKQKNAHVYVLVLMKRNDLHHRILKNFYSITDTMQQSNFPLTAGMGALLAFAFAQGGELHGFASNECAGVDLGREGAERERAS